MQFKFFLAASVAGVSLACCLAAPAYAQETSSAIRGVVEGPNGPVAGASVVVVHEPSGTKLNTITSGDGSFAANGLRVGGPFTVTVDAAGFETAQVTEVYLQAGLPVRLPVKLEAAREIVVTGASIQPKIALSDGPTTALGRAEIEAAASINRDVRDLARRDPLATIDLGSRAIEIAGNNGRLNRFSVDGMQMSDDFGLNSGGLPTSRGPVPFDAIEQFSVKVAPFDIAEGDMQGGAVNVVLRSGSNKFHGGGFFSYTDDSLTGSKSRDKTVNLNFDSKQFGGWLSGPLVKDKLFFMAAYERTKEGQPLDAGVGAGFANQVPGITQDHVDQITSIAKTRYGYDTMGLIATTQEEDEKIVAKLDWNVSDAHRASLTYIRNVGTNQYQQSTNLSSNYSLGLQSNGYELREEVNSGTFELNSTWSDVISTTARVSYRDYNRDQTPFGGLAFPQMEVCLDPGSSGALTPGNKPSECDGTVASRLVFGPDISRQANDLNTENLSIDLTTRVELGNHSLRLMTGFTRVHVYNLFLQRALGDFYFDSIAAFEAGVAQRLRYGNAVPSNDANDAAADFSTRNWTFGIQDDVQLTDNLSLTVGARYDLFDNGPLPALNPNYVDRYGFSNRETFKGRGLFQPRAAINWNATDRIAVKAGVGIFGGGTPDVYLSNVYSNTGLLTNQIDINSVECATQALCNGLGTLANPLTGGTIAPAVIEYLTDNVASLVAAPTDGIDPNLKLANKLKATFGVDFDTDLGPLGDGWLFGVQVVYDKTLQGYMWTDLRSEVIGTLPDGRKRYGPLGGNATTNRDLLLTNTTDGYGFFQTFRFEKRFGELNVSGSYTHSTVKDRAAMTSSTSSSNYSNNAFFDPNIAAYGRSPYEYTHQAKFGLDYRHAFFGDNKTTLGIFGEYRSGRPYSLTMEGGRSGRSLVFGTVGNLSGVLLYVPTIDDTKVVFDSPASQTAFNSLVTTLGLEKYRGKVIPKNSQTSPDFFKVDLHFGQELPVPLFNGGKFELFVDIENFLNMLDKDWSALRQVSSPWNAPVVSVTCNATSGDNCTQYKYSKVTAPNEVLQTRQSLYGIRVGAKVKF